MTAVARRPKAGRWHSPWMNPSPSCLTVHVLSPMCDLQSSKNEMWSFSEWLRERIVPAVGEKWVATIPESFQKWWGCKKIFKDKEAGGGADGAAGFTHSGQPGQRLGRVSGSGCKTPALSEQSSRWGPHRVHTPGTQRGRRQGKKKTLGRKTGVPFAFFNQLARQQSRGPAAEPRFQSPVPLPPHHFPPAKAAPIIIYLLRSSPPSRSHEQSSHTEFVFIIELLFLLLPSPQISLGFVSGPSAFHIFQITQKPVCAAQSRFKEQSEISFWISSYLYFVLLFLVTKEKQRHKASTGNT